MVNKVWCRHLVTSKLLIQTQLPLPTLAMLLQLLKGTVAKADDNNFTESYKGHLAEPLLMATSGLAQVSLPRLVINIHKCAYCLICCWPVQSEHARGEIRGQRTSVLMTQAARRSYLLHDFYMPVL